MGGSSVASTRRAALQPHPGRGVGPPASHGESNPLIHTILDQKCANCRGKSLFGGSESHGEALQSTAKRGWMKQCPPTHSAGDRGGPDAAGATRKNETGPNAAGATRHHCDSLRRRQSGPGGGPLRRSRTFPDSSSAGSVPTAQELLMLPGTDGKHSCGTWSRSGESEGLPLRLSGAFEDGHAGEASMASRPASQAMPRRHVESKRRV